VEANRPRAPSSPIRRALIRTRFAIPVLAVLPAVIVAACGTSSKGEAGVRVPEDLTAADRAAVGSPLEAPSSQPVCGRAGPASLARAAEHVAKQIYAREVSSTSVRADQNQVEANGPLLRALASHNRAGIRAAVHRLVFSHTHIVRLRVLLGHKVLADIGGPYILAPVGGELRLRGRTVGDYLLSVQDDLGYVKLETRYIGLPIVLHSGALRVPLEGTLAPGPANIPDLGPVSYRGVKYEAFSFNARAFPRGALRISVLVPVPGSLASAGCAAIRISEMGVIAHRIWNRFSLASAPPSAAVHSIGRLTGGLSYVRSNVRQLAGSSEPGPPSLPNEGRVKYRGVSWNVSSFSSRVGDGPIRVYVLAR